MCTYLTNKLINRLKWYGIKAIKRENDLSYLHWDEIIEEGFLPEEQIDEHSSSFEEFLDYCLRNNIKYVFFEEREIYKEELLIELEATYFETINRLKSIYKDIDERKMRARVVFHEQLRNLDSIIKSENRYQCTLKAFYLNKCMNYEYDHYSAMLSTMQINLTEALERTAYAITHPSEFKADQT